MRAVMGGNSVAGDDVEKTRSFSTYVCMHAFSCMCTNNIHTAYCIHIVIATSAYICNPMCGSSVISLSVGKCARNKPDTRERERESSRLTHLSDDAINSAVG